LAVEDLELELMSSKAIDDYSGEGKYSNNDEDEDYHGADSKNSESRLKSEEKNTHRETLSDDEILEKLQQYFYENETLANHFETFIDKNSYIIDLSSNEYKLDYTKVFDEYKSLFERKMEEFIEQDLHVSIHDVYRALKSKVDSNEDSMESFFAQVLIAVTDFDVFMNMMRDSAKKYQAESEMGQHK
jgi:hypothetical protein